jgi:hypothetical protein
MAVTLTTTPILTRAEPRRILASASAAEILAISAYDVMPDDRHFVVQGATPNPAGQRELSIITNWFPELNARLPVK